MWGQMGNRSMYVGYNVELVIFIKLMIAIWFIAFTGLLLSKMDKIIRLLEKK